jgi:hypothetical protein
MRTGYLKSFLILVFTLSWLAVTTGAAPPDEAVDPAADKTLIIDGSIVHDVGQVHLNVTNFGLLGSRPGTEAPYSEAPSARWPGAAGWDHLFAAGFWVGGIVLGERLVSTGQYESEIMATDDPLDIIYTMAMGDPGGARYPEPLPDDDGDLAEDEDPKNGRDDDADDLVDEDFGAISDQHFRCEMLDNTPLSQDLYPDHAPLNLEIVQESFQWSVPLSDQFVGFEFTIRNIGVTTIDDVYLGIFADCDIPAGVSGAASNDLAGSFSGLVEAFDGSVVPVELAYMYDGAASPAPGYIGFLFLDHTTDPAGETAPPEAALNSLQIFRGNLSFDQGGDPTNDFERYEAMSSQSWDPDALPGHQNDYRLLIASGPFPTLAPEAELKYAVALVMGNGLDDLVFNAANAVVVYQGEAFDRDGDPSNGNEFQVHWLHPEDVPVAAVSGSLTASVANGSVRLGLQTNVEALDRLLVARRDADGAVTRTWGGSEFSAVEVNAEGSSASLQDDDQAGWPRTYTLYYRGAEGDVLLDEVTVELPVVTRVDLAAHPNPFNPRVEISYQLPVAGHLQLDVVDVRGRVVKNLVAETVVAGSGSVVWLGDDAQGRAVASGVYQVVARTDQGVVKRQVTLVR